MAAKKKLRRGTGNRRKNAKDDVAEAARRERRAQVVTLRLQGHSHTAIARQMGVDERTVRGDLERWREENPDPRAPMVRAEEEARLENQRLRLTALQRVVEQRILATHVVQSGPDQGKTVFSASTDELLEGLRTIANASDRLTRLSQSRRKMHGVDSAETVEVSGPKGGPIAVEGSSSREELAGLLAGLRARLAAAKKPPGDDGAAGEG